MLMVMSANWRKFDVGDFVTIDGFDPGYLALYVSLGDCTIIKTQSEVQEQNVENVEATEMVYRGVYYGMSKDDVIETEGRVPDTDEETLISYIENIDEIQLNSITGLMISQNCKHSRL